MIQSFFEFKKIWFVDFEYQQNGSDLPTPVCMVTNELYSNQTLKLWKSDLEDLKNCPFDLDSSALYVTYFASAELWCHQSLNWRKPKNLIDLHVEFFQYTNGLLPSGTRAKLLTALEHFDIPYTCPENKDEMRDLILGTHSWNEEQKQKILNYCEADVIALKDLFLKMQERIDPRRALFRGRYLLVNAQMEANGIPLDTDLLNRLQSNKLQILKKIVSNFDPNEELFEGLTFKEVKFQTWLKANHISWPRAPMGRPKLDKETFKEEALKNKKIESLKEIRKTLSQLRETSLTYDQMGRSRCFYAPFSSLTSRNQPSNSKFIFGLAKWFRHLIKPAEGKAIAYLDWSQQEFGIAAALSKDETMMAAYLSGDPYMAFAIQAKAAPPDATKETHPQVRAQFKQCILAVQYGMGREALARKLEISFLEATELLRLHKKVYAQFWRWIQSAVDHAMLTNSMITTLGWQWNITPITKPSTLRNFHMQANGAEMLRLACIFATESGVALCAPIHDALLIEADADQINEAVEKTQQAMAKASEWVLGGFKLNSDVKIVRFPDRYTEEEAKDLWEEIESHLDHIESSGCSHSERHLPKTHPTALSNYYSSQGVLNYESP